MKHRLLVIDDNPAIHHDIQKILQRPEVDSTSFEDAEELLFGEAKKRDASLSFEIDSAYQGQDGLELVVKSLEQNSPYALAFVDVRMPPGWDGIETISRIWQVYPELQVVICTAYSDYSWEDITRKVSRSDSVLILKKPFDNIEVLQMAHALTKKWILTQESKSQLHNLDQIVSVRTQELQVANQRLLQEIADRSQAEDRLRLSEERFAKAFKSSPIPVSIQGLHDYRYLDVNDSYLLVTGYDKSQLLGNSPLELNLWPQTEARTRIFQKLLDGGSVKNVETTIRARSGEIKSTLLSAELITLGEESFALVSENDISQRLELEAQLRQAQKMEAVGHLAAGVAHDFRNILTVIQGHANLRLMTPGVDAKIAASLTQISEAVDRASNLTRQLLAFSRKQIMQLEVVNVNHLIEQLSSMLSRLIGEHIRFHCSYYPNLPFIEADVCSIEQVVLNMAVNSRDAMPHGGSLEISTRTIEVDAFHARRNAEAAVGRYVCITVTDTGCGMDEMTKERLFEPFFTTKEVGKGTGMGLATAYGLVKQHNGWIEVESAPNAGSTFKVYLPTTSKAAIEPGEKHPTGNRLQGNETILVVEDEEPLRELVATLLQEYGYNVRLASNGAEALKLWDRCGEEIDLLLTDVVMPEQISGIQLAEKLRGMRPGLPVIYTSGYSLALLENNSQPEAKFNFLPKPYPPSRLAELIRTCLDEKGTVPAGAGWR